MKKSGQLEEEEEEITPACSTCAYSTVQSRAGGGERERVSVKRIREGEKESLGLLNKRRKRKEKKGWGGVGAD